MSPPLLFAGDEEVVGVDEVVDEFAGDAVLAVPPLSPWLHAKPAVKRMPAIKTMIANEFDLITKRVLPNRIFTENEWRI